MSSVSIKSSPQSSLKLTRRGRFLFIGLPVLTTIAVLLAFIGSMLFSPKADASSVPTTVTVSQGQTLWAVAAGLGLNRDVRGVVTDIIKLNNMDGSAVYTGEKLVVPST
ncbi:MAG: LysM peptidoglycan-binding domain-containing protein [Micrococcaceae bacterium]